MAGYSNIEAYVRADEVGERLAHAVRAAGARTGSTTGVAGGGYGHAAFLVDPKVRGGQYVAQLKGGCAYAGGGWGDFTRKGRVAGCGRRTAGGVVLGAGATVLPEGASLLVEGDRDRDAVQETRKKNAQGIDGAKGIVSAVLDNIKQGKSAPGPGVVQVKRATPAVRARVGANASVRVGARAGMRAVAASASTATSSTMAPVAAIVAAALAVLVAVVFAIALAVMLVPASDSSQFGNDQMITGGAQRAIVSEAVAHGPATHGPGWCLEWCNDVYQSAGYPFARLSNAAAAYFAFCHSANRSELKPGMLIAVDRSYYSPVGHIGIYIGDGKVRDQGPALWPRTTTLDYWISEQSGLGQVRWGFPGVDYSKD